MMFLGQLLGLFVVGFVAANVHQNQQDGCSAATSREEVGVVEAVCSNDTQSVAAATFRSTTRAHHNGSAKTDG